MRTRAVPLRHLRDRPVSAVSLCELTGGDEMAVDGVDTRAAVALLARLLTATPPVAAAALSACDRDALLAALHRQCWGDRIVSTITCRACGAKYDLSFELSAVQRHLASDAPVWLARGGVLTSADGRSLTVPDASDEISAVERGVSGAVERLAERAGAEADGIAEAAAALESAAPIVDLELDATCPECGGGQNAHFDLQSFVLQRLLNERGVLFADVHLLATTYGWSLGEILALTRHTRRSFVEIASSAQP
jgi:hypothetical protein